jgi:hypothetical protein
LFVNDVVVSYQMGAWFLLPDPAMRAGHGFLAFDPGSIWLVIVSDKKIGFARNENNHLQQSLCD